MSQGIEVFNKNGIEVFSSINPFVVASRISITGGPGVLSFIVNNMPDNSSLHIVTGLMGGSVDFSLTNGGFPNMISLNSFSQNGNTITFDVVPINGVIAPTTLYYTIMASR